MSKYAIISLFFLVIILNSCDKNIVGPDDKILQIVYSNYKYPEGFYCENLENDNLYYVNTVSITSREERINRGLMGQGGQWYELSTNNSDTARHWTELTNLYSSYYREPTDERETDKFFEFRRYYELYPNDAILYRVHKLSYIDRSMYNLLNPDTVIGIFTKDNFDKDDVKELIEYLIFIRIYNNGSHKILDSACKDYADNFIHKTTEIITSYGDIGVKNEIQIWNKQYIVQKFSGLITLNSELTRTIFD